MESFLHISIYFVSRISLLTWAYYLIDSTKSKFICFKVFLLSLIDTIGLFLVYDLIISSLIKLLILIYFNIRRYDRFDIVIINSLLPFINLIWAEKLSFWIIPNNFFLEFVLTFLVIFFISQLSQKLFIPLMKTYTNTYVSVITFLSIYLYLYRYNFINDFRNYFDNLSKTQAYLINAGIVTAFVILLYATLVFIQKQSEVQKLKEIEEKMYLSTQHNKQTQQKYQQMQKFNHDSQNVLFGLKGLIIHKDFHGLKNYFYQLLDEVNTIHDDSFNDLMILSNILNNDIQSLFYTKLLYAKKLGINISIEIMEPIEFPHHMSLSLVRMFGSALDNAIEAMHSCDDSLIEITITKFSGIILVIISNPIYDEVNIDTIKKEGYSTKDHHHGLGISNILSLSERINVDVEFDTTDGMFSCSFYISPKAQIPVKVES